MDKKEIIRQLLLIIDEDPTATEERKLAISSACKLIEQAETREQWIEVIKSLGPLFVELVSKFINE